MQTNTKLALQFYIRDRPRLALIGLYKENCNFHMALLKFLLYTVIM